MGFFTRQQEEMEILVAPAREKIHEELRKMYLKSETGRIAHVSTQEAFDAAIAQAKTGIPQTIFLDGHFREIVNIPSFASEEKTLLPQPHPAGCTCPKCPEVLSPAPGVNLLPVGKVRVQDSAKGEYLERLREAYGTGCITAEEFDARVGAVMAARTRTEMDLLVRDLPVMSAMKPEKAEEPVSRPSFLHWVLNLVMVLFPIIGGAGLLARGSLAESGIVALIGGVAALVLTFMGKTGMKRSSRTP